MKMVNVNVRFIIYGKQANAYIIRITLVFWNTKYGIWVLCKCVSAFQSVVATYTRLWSL